MYETPLDNSNEMCNCPVVNTLILCIVCFVMFLMRSTSFIVDQLTYGEPHEQETSAVGLFGL